MTHIVVDPVTRIEGHLRVEAEVDGGAVTEAWSSSTMFRGIELILRGRDPRDAWAFAQRICGVCTTVHAIASIRAVEKAIGAVPPPNARLLRNLIMAAQNRSGPRDPFLPPARPRLGRHRQRAETATRPRPPRLPNRSRTGRCPARHIFPACATASRPLSSADSSASSPTPIGAIPPISCRPRPTSWRWRTIWRRSTGSGVSSRSTPSSAARIRTCRASWSAAWRRRSILIRKTRSTWTRSRP